MSRTGVALGLLLLAAGPAAGQTRSFFDAQCSYTRPGVEWEWLDPKTGETVRTLVVARNPSGITFALRYRPKDQRPDANSFGAFEDHLLASGEYQKLDSRRFFFKGVLCYQVDVQHVRRDEYSRIRLLFANDKVYQFGVTYAPGPLGSDEETDVIFRGFEFRPPRDLASDGEPETALGKWFDDTPTLLWVGLFAMAVAGIWVIIRLRAGGNRY
jgi:hypothetical protein